MELIMSANSAALRARTNMIEGQLRPNKVTDVRLLDAVAAVPREAFVPDEVKSVAYIDEKISLGDGRWLMEPMVLVRLIQALEISPSDKVLDIGAGTGYAAAILSKLAAGVTVIEELPALSYIAMANLQKLGCDNAEVITNPLAAGYPKNAPYEAILVEGSVDAVPESVLNQLAEGGRLAAVRMGKGMVGEATLWRRTGGALSVQSLFDAGVPMLPGFSAPKGFAF